MPKARTPNTPDVQTPTGMVVDRDRYGSANESREGAFKAQPGQVERGNVNLYGRPGVSNRDGSTSTVRSMSFSDGPGREVLIPTAYEGAVHPDEEAIRHYRATGEHMGVYNTPQAATSEAQRVHQDYAGGRYADEGSRVLEDARPRRSTGEVSGDVSRHNQAPDRPAHIRTYEQGFLQDAKNPNEQAARAVKVLKTGFAKNPLVQEVRMPEDLSDKYNEGFTRLSDAVAPIRESRGMRLAADKVANSARRFQNDTISRSQQAMDSKYGQMAAGLYGAVDGQEAGPRRAVAKAVEKLSPGVRQIEIDQPTELPEVTVEGEDSLKKKK